MDPLIASVIILPLIADSNIQDGSIGAGKAWLETIQAIGCLPALKQIHWGLKEEDQSLVCVVVWDQQQRHLELNTLFDQKTQQQPFRSVVRLPPMSFRVNFFAQFPENSSNPLLSPLTEIILHFFPHSSLNKQQAIVFEKRISFLRSLQNEVDTLQSFMVGYMVDEDKGVLYEKTAGMMGSGDVMDGARVMMSVVGWPNVEAHMSARETKTFQSGKNNLLLGAHGGGMFHVAFTQV